MHFRFTEKSVREREREKVHDSRRILCIHIKNGVSFRCFVANRRYLDLDPSRCLLQRFPRTTVTAEVMHFDGLNVKGELNKITSNVNITL